jgi:FKBP-type peptidyl-prolyl cis-trans isomerase FkpA
MKKIVLLLLLLVSITACRTYSEDDKQSFDAQIKTYLEKKGIECERSESGLYYKIIEEGEGEYIKFTDVVSFTYKGEFLDGEVFDNEKKPVDFMVKDLIGAWKEIMLELKPGAKAFLVAPPSLGYGDRQLDDIPANSILVFNMEVVGVK